ncbi:MAG: hypothetical protein JRJ77_08570 [Deltaproteobacteria bacterium]|nr:hypothetical protein [Deltaproteobacteria bacterium]MBW2338929.1 hypothetical protein [Deltaproteobacteria bacterium]
MLGTRKLIDGVVKTTVMVMIGFCTVGMGGVGEEKLKKIPEPDDNFSATVIDQRDVASPITLFSLEGQTFLSGKRGGAMVSIPFENIKEINFYARGKDIFATVTMKKEAQVELEMEKDRIFYGQLSYGLLSIKVEYVKKIAIHGLAEQEK